MAKQFSKIDIILENVSPLIGKKQLYKGINFSIETGKSLAIMGSSGIGKTLLLNSILGECQHTGSIKLSNDFFTVFQDNNQLFPWMTIEKNLKFACKNTKNNILQKWNIEHLIKFLPHQLSVGQRQRITLARALQRKEKILLCDEPLSAVDSINKIKIAKDFKDTAALNKKTVVWVTHDVLEAKAVGDDIMIINKNSFKIFKNTAKQNEILQAVK